MRKVELEMSNAALRAQVEVQAARIAELEELVKLQDARISTDAVRLNAIAMLLRP